MPHIQKEKASETVEFSNSSITFFFLLEASFRRPVLFYGEYESFLVFPLTFLGKRKGKKRLIYPSVKQTAFSS